MNLLNGLYILGRSDFQIIYPESIHKQIEKRVNVYAPPQTKESIEQNPLLLEKADVIFSGWDPPILNEAFLQKAPRLKAFFYGAGSVKSLVTDAFWERDIRLTSSYAANAIPVAEYVLSQILFALKHGWYLRRQYKEIKSKDALQQEAHQVPGAYGSTVGMISLGMVGKTICRLLQAFDVNIIAYDPYVSAEQAAEFNVKLCSLEEVFQWSDVVSLNTPWLKETEGMITGDHLASMKPKATFINASRGAVVREQEMIKVLQTRPDLQVVLDVTWPEPPEADSLLYTLPNVMLTPHIAGSSGAECARMGEYVVRELDRFIAGEPPIWGITKEKLAIMS